MNRRRLLTLVAILPLLPVLFAGLVSAQDEPDYIATIEAQATRIAELEATVAARGEKINAQRTTIAELRNPEPTPTPKSQAGQSVEINGWRITFVSTEVASTIESYDPLTAAGVYLIVNLTVQNTGNAPTEFPYRDLQVEDGKGRRFSADYDPTFWYWTVVSDDYPNDPLQPGIDYAFPVVFDVAPDANGFTLTSSRGAFDIRLDR